MNEYYNGIKRMCSFYVSDAHLCTMILPYISEKLNENKTVEILSDKNINSSIDLLLSKLNLKEEIKNKIKSINWTKNKMYKYMYFEKSMKKVLNNKKECYLFLVGDENHIDVMNLNLEKWMKKNKEKTEKININIINCYEIMHFNENIKSILDKNDKILNTSGEKEIKEVFSDYIRNGDKKAQ